MYQYFMIQWRQRYIEYRLPCIPMIWFMYAMKTIELPWILALSPIKFVYTLKGECCTGPFYGAGARMGSFFPLQERN